MKSLFFRLLTTFAIAASSSLAIAQEHTSADELIQAGLSSLRQIDEDRAGELWEASSAFIKTRLPKEAFVGNMRQTRKTVGNVSRRDWASVVRIRYLDDSSGVPAGQYANVDFATTLTSNKVVFEKVSFRLEPNGWTMTGYIPRENQ